MEKIISLGDGLKLSLHSDLEYQSLPPWVTSKTLILIFNAVGSAVVSLNNKEWKVASNTFLLCQGCIPDQGWENLSPALFYFDLTEAFDDNFCCVETGNSLKALFSDSPILELEPEAFWISDANKILNTPSTTFLDRMALKQQALKLFHSVLCYALREQGSCHCVYIQHRNRLEKAKQILEKEYAHPPLVGELADRLSLSPYHLQQGFKSLTGHTVYEYIKQCRFEKATDLLLHSDLSITDIALEVGYENPSKFSQMFKHYAKTTPLLYRKQNIF